MENEIISDESYKREKALGYKEIVLGQVQRIVVIYSRELIEGFYKWTAISGHGMEKSGYISDGREAYANAVYMLHDLLQPKFDKRMKEAGIKNEEKVDNLFNEMKKTKNRKQFLHDRTFIIRELFQELCMFLERMGWLVDDTESED